MPLELKDNNLWLLDDKFMKYNYIASERRLNTLLKFADLEGISTDERFDIAIYTQNTKRVILVEMKKFSANYKENGEGISQLYTYAKRLKTAQINEVYLYLIANIDDDFRDLITGERGFTRVFSQEGELYQRNYNDINAYVQVISPIALIADAQARNKTFLSFIKSQTN